MDVVDIAFRGLDILWRIFLAQVALAATAFIIMVILILIDKLLHYYRAMLEPKLLEIGLPESIARTALPSAMIATLILSLILALLP